MSDKKEKDPKKQKPVQPSIPGIQEKAFIDLVKTTKPRDLKYLLDFNNYQLLVFFYHSGISLDIIWRLKNSGCNGSTFYEMGTTPVIPSLDTPNRWYFFTKGGISDYKKLSKLEEIIRQYHQVCNISCILLCYVMRICVVWFIFFSFVDLFHHFFVLYIYFIIFLRK